MSNVKDQAMKRFTDIIWWSVVSIVLILVTLLIAIKMLLPYVDNYRPQIERNLSQISGYEIQIKKISAKLEGLDPSFSISGVSLSVEDETQPLYFERLMIRFNFWASVNLSLVIFASIIQGLAFLKYQASGL